jgi:predicted DCC family thiol-disulfide oxidoreductase YuxK
MATPTLPQVETQNAPMLVYDGSCGFCNRSVQFILRHERRHDLRFVSRDSELGKSLRHKYGMNAVESMLWIDESRVFAESDAVIRAANYLGRGWSTLAVVGSLLPSFLRNTVYRFIARNRRRISSRASVCLVPSPEQRSRFLG